MPVDPLLAVRLNGNGRAANTKTHRTIRESAVSRMRSVEHRGPFR